MPKFMIAALISLMLSFGALAANSNTKYDPNTLPVFTGNINDPTVRVVYEDTTGTYVVVIVDGVMKIFYL